MKLKLALSTATALALCMGSAWAGNYNDSNVDQSGASGNAAVITQSGSHNSAGSSDAGLPMPMVQEGYNNKLTIDQSGNHNDIGLESNAFSSHSGVYQENDDNSSVTFQTTITQSSSFNAVGSVNQIASGDASSGVRNSVTINQDGSFFGYGGNRVGSVYQERKSSGKNVLTVNQDGVLDRLEKVYQRSNTGGNSPNTINVTMTGGLSGGNGHASSLGGFAGASGAESSALKQGNLVATSRGNNIMLNVSGLANNFGVTQNGNDNSVGTLSIGGAFNQVGVNQNGDRNQLALAAVNGVFNNIGVNQNQDDNYASVSVTGNNNQLGVEQYQGNNDAEVAISGDYNGGGTLMGAAGTLAAAHGLDSGLIRQDGQDNLASLTITNSSNNQFAFLQDGDQNVITGNVSGAGSNSATMVQVGSNNTSTFSQTGGGNMVSVNQ